MSWSLSRIGSKEKVREAVIADFDRCAANYAGKEEEKDVLAIKERALSAIDEVKTNGVKVDASGSRTQWSTVIKLDVVSVELL